MRKYPSVLLGIILFSISILSGCGGGGGNPGGNPDNPGENPYNPVVYAAGNFYDGNIKNSGDPIACYWINGKQINIGNPGQNQRTAVRAICGSNGTIYIGGDFYDLNQNQCYYIVNDPAPRLLNNWLQVLTITCSGNDIYFVGDYNTGGPCYWKVGDPSPVMLDLADSENGQAFSICVSGNDKYAAGFCQRYSSDAGVINKVCYWRNGTIKKLSENRSEARSVMMKDGKLYIAGWEYYQSTYDAKACYWVYDAQTGNILDLVVLGDYSSFATCMTECNGKIITAGSLNDSACYWVDDNPTPIILSSDKASVQSVFVSGGKIYFGGYSEDPNSKRRRACYWISGQADTFFVGPVDSPQSEVYSIYVE